MYVIVNLTIQSMGWEIKTFKLFAFPGTKAGAADKARCLSLPVNTHDSKVENSVESEKECLITKFPLPPYYAGR